MKTIRANKLVQEGTESNISIQKSIVYLSTSNEQSENEIKKQFHLQQRQKAQNNTCNGILALKRKKILTNATTWMNLEDIMLNEINQSQETKYYMTPLIHNTNCSQIHTQKVRWWLSGTRGWGE